MPPQRTTKTALLVVDMQAFFTPMTTTSLPNILTLIHHFRHYHFPTIYTQHGHPPADLTGPPYPNQLVRKWGVDGSIHRGSADWAFQPEIQKLVDEEGEGAEVVQKNTYDAFINTDLEERLRGAGVARVVVCGVMTDCCCDTTARSAFSRGWETWLVRDACGSAGGEQHEAGLRGFAFAFGDVVETEEVVKRVKG